MFGCVLLFVWCLFEYLLCSVLSRVCLGPVFAFSLGSVWCFFFICTLFVFCVCSSICYVCYHIWSVCLGRVCCDRCVWVFTGVFSVLCVFDYVWLRVCAPHPLFGLCRRCFFFLYISCLEYVKIWTAAWFFCRDSVWFCLVLFHHCLLPFTRVCYAFLLCLDPVC